jgi:prolyl-tRNA synthetase
VLVRDASSIRLPVAYLPMLRQLFRFSDRRDVSYLLAPTHEEEITTLVSRTVKSYKELPLRLYQITRKYRDEFRPRHGLLRGREFVMKDLYTFDNDIESALNTYAEVRDIYARLFSSLKLPVLAAKASSGSMGGSLSHEYHLPTPHGEDRVVSCSSCGYTANEEVADMRPPDGEISPGTPLGVWRGITKDRSTLVNVWYPKWTKSNESGQLREYTNEDINLSAIKSLVPDIDTAIGDALGLWSTAVAPGTQTATKLVNVVDPRLGWSLRQDLNDPPSSFTEWPSEINPPQAPLAVSFRHGTGTGGESLNLMRIRADDKCPQCSSGKVKVERAMELGHTFFLGTRYSGPLGAVVTLPGSSQPTPMQMGCHGIGISRVVGATAEYLADEKGLNWPLAIAPYSCVIVPGKDATDDDAQTVYHQINNISGPSKESLDVVVDDRERSMPWKLGDADLVGFPIIVILGREWRSARRVEIQCRRMGIKQVVEVADLPNLVQELHAAL